MAKERNDQTVDQRSETEKSDFSHLMITSAFQVDPTIEARDGHGSVIFWDNHPEFKAGKMVITDAAANTATGPPTANMDQYGTPEAWQQTGGVSLDGLFVPYSTNFKIVSDAGTTTDKNKPFNVSMPSYERPYSTTSKGKVEDKVEWDGAGVDSPGVGLGIHGPAPPFITSVSYNPFASGHYVRFVNKNKETTDPNIDVTGYAKHAQPLTTVSEISDETSRPVGLRGPLVVAGWGYDTYGRPVPNLRFDSDYRHDDHESANYGRQRYVPRTMQGRTESGAQRDYKHFLPHAMRRPDKWKVGPVDLRWDNQRKVWVGGKHNGIYLSKATKCIMPQAGVDGNNSFNFGVGGNINAPGRLYRNPCPTHECTPASYFPTSIYYPDLEIYDPEDHNWCGRCRTLGHVTACADFKDGCIPFYDAIILRPIDEMVGEPNVLTECTDKFRKVEGGSPSARRAGNPCHGWGSSYFGEKENINTKIGKDKTWSQQAKSLMYEKIFIENPLGQGLMVGDAFFSYDTGKRITYEYERVITTACANTGTDSSGYGDTITVKETIPVHIILQGEFYGMEIITHAGCDRGEMAACSKKFFAQGFATDEDCGPDDNYPQTAGI